MHAPGGFSSANFNPFVIPSRLHLLGAESDYLLHAEPQLPAPVNILLVLQPNPEYAALSPRQSRDQLWNGAALVHQRSGPGRVQSAVHKAKTVLQGQGIVALCVLKVTKMREKWGNKETSFGGTLRDVDEDVTMANDELELRLRDCADGESLNKTKRDLLEISSSNSLFLFFSSSFNPFLSYSFFLPPL